MCHGHEQDSRSTEETEIKSAKPTKADIKVQLSEAKRIAKSTAKTLKGELRVVAGLERQFANA